MQKSRKIGLLILLLAIPIFFVLFFELFSTSHYAIPVYYETGIDSLAECEPSQSIHQVSTLSARNVVGDQPQSLEFTNILRAVYILPTECSEDCRTILEELARVQGVLESQTSLQTVLIGGDPSFSDLAEEYASSQSTWLFLEGTGAQFPSFLQCELVLPRVNIPLHETLVLVDQQGRIRGYYRGTDASEIDRLIAEIRILEYSANTE
ncbi:MAG: hypothetical protein AAF632_23350 [Bacteroidota bacterium]